MCLTVLFLFDFRYQTIVALFMETEIWANYLVHLHKNHIPTFLLNVRLSEKSYLGY